MIFTALLLFYTAILPLLTGTLLSMSWELVPLCHSQSLLPHSQQRPQKACQVLPAQTPCFGSPHTDSPGFCVVKSCPTPPSHGEACQLVRAVSPFLCESQLSRSNREVQATLRSPGHPLMQRGLGGIEARYLTSLINAIYYHLAIAVLIFSYFYSSPLL